MLEKYKISLGFDEQESSENLKDLFEKKRIWAAVEIMTENLD